QDEIVAILGTNGAGKSTTLMTVSGLIKPSKGKISLSGAPIHQLPGHEIVKRGIAQVPEGRRIFGTLTTQENINLGAYVCRDKDRVKQTEEWVYSLFPVLQDRRNQLAGTLSGGEQQMLAIARALMAAPRLLLLDEPSMGLAPLVVQVIFDILKTIREQGVTVLLVEQNAAKALELADRGYVLETGRIVLQDSADVLLRDDRVRMAYLGADIAS
ncbi:MAG TPA: ABC transporter ATP-binding protein, partial [Acidimicrobiales bacterium]|nr:ABC transporter ATP-binding protein [Acidimicrobiales bacterium]